jgi:hypothetical protein
MENKHLTALIYDFKFEKGLISQIGAWFFN